VQRGVGWEAAVAAFIADGKRRNLAPATVTTYEAILSNPRTTQFRLDHGLERVADLTPERLKEFEGELLEAGLTPRSVIGYHRVVKTFAAFCIREGYGGSEAVLSVEGPKQEQKEPQAFTVAEEKQLLEATETERDRLLVEFMLRTGLRLQEVARVTIDDIVESPEGAYVRVRQGKGRKDRIVPLDTGKTRLSTKLLRYASRSRGKASEERALFLSARGGRGGTGGPLTMRGIQVVLTRLGEQTGIHVHPHKFRHTFATRALSAGVDVMALQRALGHTTLAMVSRYVHYQRDDLLEAWRRRRD
ncbi:MAG: tyrosine-type recombinase/integrase, partial [Candidatus Dormibacteria bacterium]